MLFGCARKINEVSEEEKGDQRLRHMFSQFDPEELGFVPSALLGDLMRTAGVQAPEAEFSSLADPERTGVIVFQKFRAAIEEWKKREQSFVSCPACTFNVSEICEFNPI